MGYRKLLTPLADVEMDEPVTFLNKCHKVVSHIQQIMIIKSRAFINRPWYVYEPVYEGEPSHSIIQIRRQYIVPIANAISQAQVPFPGFQEKESTLPLQFECMCRGSRKMERRRNRDLSCFKMGFEFHLINFFSFGNW